MSPCLETDICVIGGGSGGLVVAAVAAQLGVPTILVEKHKMGGDCLNYGCVPSKALLAAAHAAEGGRRARRFGVSFGSPKVDARGVFGHVAKAIATIAPHDSVERFEEFGVRVIKAAASFTGRREISAGAHTIRARRFVVASGSGPFVPPIPGLSETPYLTNETVFDQESLPAHLIVVGAGPIGMEMAQAHRQLGARVTVLEMFSMLPNDDPELVDILRRRIKDEGIDLREGVKVVGTEKNGAGVAVKIENADGPARIEGSRLLIAAGRRPNTDGLNLAAAGIAHDAKGIRVDARLRTSNKRVFAIGDVAGGYQFTHVAGYHAGIVIRNALFRIPAKVDYAAVPWVTYTAPELAQVGMTEAAASQRGMGARVLRWSLGENDRAVVEDEADGMLKVMVTPKGRILGASIVGPHAGELIQVWGLAIQAKLKIGAIANMIAPYPTLGEANKRIAGDFFKPKLFSDRSRWLVGLLRKLG